MSFEIRGAEQLALLSKALKVAGQTDLRKELNKAVRDSLNPVKDDVRASALRKLPRRGGYAARVAKSRFNVSRYGGGVRLKFVGGSTMRRINNQGILRHPVFARSDQTRDQWEWVNQPVRGGKGWFDEPTQAAAPEIRREIQDAMFRTILKLERRV